ncbi:MULTISPECIES: alpha/beta fold hydrolase [unclassified Streptomyces]|uniref:alpha/beta fold hydrolase n=1 Tax=unclassified Streptomyces TaxID=2593676 RepID=UPI00247565B9|nr:alpha/beta hydrolase [Streptomyces sp. SAI-041]
MAVNVAEPHLDAADHRVLDFVPTLMIYGDYRDLVARSENLTEFVPNGEVVSMDCGHRIQQAKPEETNRAITK